MATGWLETGGSRYYLDGSGAMLANRWAWVEGKCYYFNPTGRVQSGWINWYGTWYWLEPSDGGAMATGLADVGSRKCYFGADGAMRTGWQKLDGSWYYFNASGYMQTGWVNVGGGRYWLADDGKMFADGLKEIAGKLYSFTSSGAVRTNCILRLENDECGFADATGAISKIGYYDGNDIVFRNADGTPKSGWQLIGGKYFYAQPGTGVMHKGWLQLGNTWYYLNDNGVMVTGLQTIRGYRYYFLGSGAWVGNTGNAELNDYINTIIVSRGTNLRTLFNYVASYPYRNGSKNPTGNWSVPFALEMYRNGGGNCYRYAALFCELAKAVGYDARVVAGSVPSYSAGWAPHGWVEIRMNGTTYVCDPDLQHEIPSRNWYMFTYGQAPTNYRY